MISRKLQVNIKCPRFEEPHPLKFWPCSLFTGRACATAARRLSISLEPVATTTLTLNQFVAIFTS